jgi:Mg2+-importing ATPase
MKDEADLVFAGFMTFFDPPKESAAPAIAKLKEHGIDIKVLTGDNELVTKKVCREVNLDYSKTLVGNQIEQMSDRDLVEEANKTTIFARLSPEHKRRIVKALRHRGHVVGYLGDGINDAPALRAADVGISVNSAVDIAKESADIILLELSLTVLSDGVIEGRKVFGNIIKYIKMGASSNFGNMFSVLGASIFLPFLPMTPIQLITNNLLYDLSQTAIPTDTVDAEYIEKPRKWQIKDIARFMVFIGPMSSIFDFSTFFMMLYVFNAWKQPALFQTGWFVESLLTQTLIVHVIRSRKIPFLQTWASRPLLLMTTTIMVTGILLTISPLAPLLGFVQLPLLYWPLLIVTLVTYITLTQLMKMWYIKKYGYN